MSRIRKGPIPGWPEPRQLGIDVDLDSAEEVHVLAVSWGHGPDIVEFLDQLRALGVDEQIVQVERDGWIPLVARSPERVPELIARKREHIARPQLLDFYLTLSQALDQTDSDPMLIELLDTLALDTAPPARRLIELLNEQGWSGWTKLEPVHTKQRSRSSR